MVAPFFGHDRVSGKALTQTPDDKGFGTAIRHCDQVRPALVADFQRLSKQVGEKSPCFPSDFYRRAEMIRHDLKPPKVKNKSTGKAQKSKRKA
jgi:hypothetical protein